MHPFRALLISLASLLPAATLAQGTVLIVVGSDTGVWDGLNVTQHHCTLGSTLYTDPTRNATRVMQPAFREPMVDYYGTPMKLTWWMMAGNMFRLSVNTDVPTPSTLPVYQMKQNHGDGLRRWGDELTFHYHDWIWSDEDGDGTWFWNQAPSFTDAMTDFDRTLAELLIEEKMFPVSFRSGWHAMDNSWQQRLNEVLPFSLHNDYPAKHVDPIEPFDNVYDWSHSSPLFVPFHPSNSNYQVPGEGPGWNVRCRYMSAADSTFMSTLFARAQAGTDQVVCLWAHLPETDFPENLQKVNRSVHAAASAFPTVAYRYCTAVEAMQRWLRATDTTKPAITLIEHRGATNVGWTVTVDEPIFQPEPIVAIKDRYEEHRLLPMSRVTQTSWQTISPVPLEDLVAISVAVTDTSGNLNMLQSRYLPDDVFVDNTDPGYEELAGTWTTVPLRGWGASHRIALVNAFDTASARWLATIPARGQYAVFLRIPSASNPAGGLHVTVSNGRRILDTVISSSNIRGDAWLPLTTAEMDPASPVLVQVTSRASGAQTLTADVLRLTPMVPLRSVTGPDMIDVDDIIFGTKRTVRVPFRNGGSETATIVSANLASGLGVVTNSFPFSVPAMAVSELSVELNPERLGIHQDTLIAMTDDARHPVLRTHLTTLVREYFVLSDDGDSTAYQETGTWRFSSAFAEGPTSRYAVPSSANTATFSASIERAGRYEISEIIPATVNGSDRAQYILRISGADVDSAVINQNTGSGGWVLLMTDDIPSNSVVAVTVTDAMSPIIPNRVLRVDAVQFQWISATGTTVLAPEPSLPLSTSLLQNYPNPFNPTSLVTFELSQYGPVDLRVYDSLGREVAVLINDKRSPGRYTVTWDARRFTSGVYFYTLRTGHHNETKRMILVK